MLILSDDPLNAPRIEELETRLLNFYSRNACYYESASSADKVRYLNPVAEIARSMAEKRSPVRVLEFGCGLSQLPEVMSAVLPADAYKLVFQDINDTNRGFYDDRGLDLHVGDISEVKDHFDIVLSMFVYEHLTRPAAVLRHISGLLSPGGKIILVCPQYTAPLYIPPALCHLPRVRQLAANIKLLAGSFLVRATGRPRFWVETDPAVLHRSWRRDFDAVHMVSRSDLAAFLGPNWRMENLKVEAGRSLREFLYQSLQLAVVCTRRSGN